MDYRREIDGLRAVAVIPVILFHADFAAFSGGFVGVDVFFVISGYLITTLIVSEIDEGRFSFANFYERRARRILPALFLVILASMPFAWLWMSPAAQDGFARSVGATALFVSNILFRREVNYFGPAAAELPLLHTWSLAIEEQFYVLFPLLLVAAWRFGATMAALLFIIIAVASLGLAESVWSHSAIFNFYLILTRAWELLIGALLAIWLRNCIRPSGAAAMLMALAGLGMIAWSVFIFDKATPFPSVYALVPTIGTALVILAATPADPVGRLLGWRPLVGIGLISYSAYLWHHPLFAFTRIRFPDAVASAGGALFAALTLLALGLAFLTWRYIEQPFRQKGRISRRTVVILLPALSLAMVGVGVLGKQRRFELGDMTAEGRAFLTSYDGLQKAIASYREDCNFYMRFEIPGDCLEQTDNHLPTTVVWGDSHAQALLAGLRRQFGQTRFFAQLTGSSCLPKVVDIPPETLARYPENNGAFVASCEKANATAVAYLRSHAVESVVIVLSGGYPAVDWASLFNLLRDVGVRRLFIFGPMPQWIPSLPFAHAKALGQAGAVSTDSFLIDRSFVETQYMQKVTLPLMPQAQFLSPVGLLCSETRSCRYVVPGAPKDDPLVVFDYGHLSFSGADYVAGELFKGLF